jgi:sec-independent protein translocase protein TatA
MATLGGWEWVIILVIVLLVFGVGRISKLGSEMGKGISAFRDGMKEGQEGKDEDDAVVEAKEGTEAKEA